MAARSPESIPPEEPPAPTRVPVDNAERLAAVKRDLDAALNYPAKNFPAPGALKSCGRRFRPRQGRPEPSARKSGSGLCGSELGAHGSAARAGEAFETGRGALATGGAVMWPQDLARVLESYGTEGAGPQLERQAALRSGALSNVYEKVGTKPNDLSALKQVFGGENDFNRSKAGMLFGPQNRDAMLESD